MSGQVLHRFALALASGLAALFTVWQVVLAVQAHSRQHALQTHTLRAGQAVVTSVARASRRGGWCVIELTAAIESETGGARAPVTGPGGSLSLIGDTFDWFDCHALRRPAAYQRQIAVGDLIGVVYAVDDPAINRPAWVDYPRQRARVAYLPFISMALAILFGFAAARRGA